MIVEKIQDVTSMKLAINSFQAKYFFNLLQWLTDILISKADASLLNEAKHLSLILFQEIFVSMQTADAFFLILKT